MTILQGSDAPIILDFDEDVSGVSKMSIGLYDIGGTQKKHYTKSDVEIDETIVYCPLTQAETAELPVGRYHLVTKFLSDDGEIIFYDDQKVVVANRYDRSITL